MPGFRAPEWSIRPLLRVLRVDSPAIAALCLAVVASLPASPAYADGPLPTIVSTGTTSFSSDGSATMPVGTRPGDFALWQMVYSTTSVQRSAPWMNGWKLLSHDIVLGNARRVGQAVFYRFLDGSEHGTQVASWNADVDLARISVFRGVSAETPFEGSQLASGIGTSTRTLPDMTTTGPNRLLTCFGGQTEDVTTLPDPQVQIELEEVLGLAPPF